MANPRQGSVRMGKEACIINFFWGGNAATVLVRARLCVDGIAGVCAGQCSECRVVLSLVGLAVFQCH